MDAPAYAIVEHFAAQKSSLVFLYDIAEDSGFGKLTKQWTFEDHSLAKYVSLQTRAGAGLSIVGRLSEGTSKEVEKSGTMTAYTTPTGLERMSSALALLPKPTSSGRLVIQVASITPVGSQLVLSPTLAPVHDALYSLPDSFVVLLSSTPQETVELASVAYTLPNNHVVHVFDHYSSARESSHLILPSELSTSAVTIQDALSEVGYGFFDYAGDNEAQTVLVLLNGPLATAAKVLASQISGLGVVVVRVLRPWDEKAFGAVLPSTVKNVHVLDDVPIGTAQGGLFVDVFSTIFDSASPSPSVQTHRIVPKTTQDFLASPTVFSYFLAKLSPNTQGINPTSLNLAIAPTLKRLLFFSGANSGLTGLPRVISKTFLSHKSIKTRHLTSYDALSKVGGVAADRILLSTKSELDDHVPVPLLLPLDPDVTEGKADFIGILDQTLVKTHSLLKYARRGAAVLVSTNWTASELLENLPSQALDIVRSHDLRLYVIDANGLAQKLLPNASSSVVELLAQTIGYLAFLRLYISQSEEVGKSAVAKVALTLFGRSIEGAHVDTVCAETWDALESAIPLAEEATTDEEKKSSALRDFEFNTVEPDCADYPIDVGTPKVGTWHDAAKQFIFREAFTAPAITPTSESDHYPQIPGLRPDLSDRTFLVTTTVNRRLTPKEYDRNVFHLEFDTSGTGLKYAIGEALGVHGWNDDNEVLEFCKWYGADPDQLITLPAPGRGERVMHTRTVFQALQQQVDLFGKPHKSFYAELSKYATEKADKMALYFTSSPEGSATFKKLSEKETVTFADILKAYPSARPPIAELCELIGDIEPRHYSIASSQAVVGDRVDLLVVTVDWVTPSGELTVFFLAMMDSYFLFRFPEIWSMY